MTHLRLAVGVLPERTPIWRDALWHLSAALEADGKSQQALLYYMKNYVTGLPDPFHRAIIETLYRKVNGSLDGLDEKIGPSPFATIPRGTSNAFAIALIYLVSHRRNQHRPDIVRSCLRLDKQGSQIDLELTGRQSLRKQPLSNPFQREIVGCRTVRARLRFRSAS